MRSVLSLQLYGDRFLSRVVHDVWLQRAESEFLNSSPYFLRSCGAVDVEQPNLAVVNPSRDHWQFPSEFGADEDTVDAWNGEINKVNLWTASESDAAKQHLSKKGILTLRTQDRSASMHFSSTEISDTLEALRLLSETCDYLDSIDILLGTAAEGFAQPGPLLEGIRDDFGNSPIVQVYVAYNESPLSALNKQVTCATCVETANMVIPLHTACDQLQTAAAIETISSFRYILPSTHPTDSSVAPHLSSLEWWRKCTAQGRFPIVSLEFSPESQTLEQMERSLATLRRDQRGSERTRGATRNPFLADYSHLRGDASEEARYERPLTNCVLLRGSANEEVRHRMFMQCVDSYYLISHLEEVHEEAPKEACREVGQWSAASLGCSAHTGRALEAMSRALEGAFSERLSRLLPLEAADVAEHAETLLSLAERYAV